MRRVRSQRKAMTRMRHSMTNTWCRLCEHDPTTTTLYNIDGEGSAPAVTVKTNRQRLVQSLKDILKNSFSKFTGRLNSFSNRRVYEPAQPVRFFLKETTGMTTATSVTAVSPVAPVITSELPSIFYAPHLSVF